MKSLSRKISPKGQVTIPRKMRTKLGLKSGDRVIFSSEGKDLRIKKQSNTCSVIGLMDAHADKLARGISLSDMKKAVAKRMAQRVGKS